MKVTTPIKLDSNTSNTYPLASQKVIAGFPSPADDFVEKKISLDELLIKHNAATYLVRVEGESMIEKGIFPEDILIVDKSIEPKNNDVVIAEVDGEFTVKIFRKTADKIYLQAANGGKTYNLENSEFSVWGIVTSAVHNFRK